MKIVKNSISECAEGEDKVNLFQIIVVEVGGRGICGGSVEGVARFYMSLVGECNTVSHTPEIGSIKYLPRAENGIV